MKDNRFHRRSQKSEKTLSYEVLIQRLAKNDILEYSKFLIQQSSSNEVAERWLDQLEREILGLAEMPKRYPIIPEQSHFEIELRHFICYSHRVIFHVDDERSRVRVLRIFQVRRDYFLPGDIEQNNLND